MVILSFTIKGKKHGLKFHSNTVHHRSINKLYQYGIMKKLYKGSKNNGKNVETNEGERGLLYSNKAIVRSPSLAFNPNKEYVSEDIALDYLASILVEIYLYNKDANIKQKGSDLLPCVNKRTS